MMETCLTRRVLVTGLIVLLCAGPVGFAVAQDWQPELLAPESEDGIRHPSDPIQIRLPADLPARVLENLALELDSFDVTQLLQRDGDTFILHPPTPLDPGVHQLRLVEYAADGGIREIGVWDLTIRRSGALQDFSASANLTAELDYRFADRNLQSPPPRSKTRGAGQFRGALSQENWGLRGDLNALFEGRDADAIDGRNLDIGDYLFTGDGALN